MYWITGLLGLVMIAAPWVFNYTDNNTALWASIILGAVIVLVSGYKAVTRDTQTWEYWVAGFVGVAVIAAPFFGDFTALTEALWTSIIVGALVVVVSGY